MKPFIKGTALLAGIVAFLCAVIALPWPWDGVVFGLPILLISWLLCCGVFVED